MEISLNDALLLQNKGNKILFDTPPPHTHAQKGSRIQTKCLSIPVVHDLAQCGGQFSVSASVHCSSKTLHFYTPLGNLIL